MKLFLKNIANQLKEYSESLDKQSLFIDKPWALIDGDLEMQRLIFKKGGELILSKNGKVKTGSWEYLSGSNSLLIDQVNEKILCNEEFIDEGVMILKLDGTENKFFTLANENIVPDLNVEKYLSELRQVKFEIKEIELNSGDKLEILQDRDRHYIRKALINGNPPQDGDYILKETNKRAVIKNGMLKYVRTLHEYTTKDGLSIYIDQKRWNAYERGDYAYKDSNRMFSLEDGRYKLGWVKSILVKNGRVV